MNNDGGFLGWVLGGIATMIATLTGAIAKMYHSQIAEFKQRETTLETKVKTLEEKVDHCEGEHHSARVELAKLETRLSMVETKVNA